jgi:hypothetical protein
VCIYELRLHWTTTIGRKKVEETFQHRRKRDQCY